MRIEKTGERRVELGTRRCLSQRCHERHAARRDEFQIVAEFAAALHEIVIGLQAEKESGREPELPRQP
jgi:hypothetical protein